MILNVSGSSPDTPAIFMQIQILDKVVRFEETPIRGLFKIFVSDKGVEESIPLLIEEYQIKTFKKIILDTNFDLNIPFTYFKLVISGCVKYAMKN